MTRAATDNPFDPERSLEIARAQIRRQANDALIKGSLLLGVMGLVGSAQILALIAAGKPGFELPLRFALLGAAMGFTIRVLARRGLMFGKLKYAACVLFVSMPTGFLLTSHFVMPGGAATYLNGPMPHLYFMLLVMTGFLFDVRLTITCGVVAGLGYLAAAQLAMPSLALLRSPDAITQQDLTDPPIYWIKGFMITFTSLVVAALSHVARTIILSTVKKAYERGNYTLVERIGRGGMGEVWVAHHNMLARKAAVKLIRSDTLGSGASGGDATAMLERFEREAQATAKLRSPHTISLYDFGLADDGTFYYVMELLQGLDLDTLVRRHGPQPAERVVYLLQQVLASLEEAHRFGLVHRDIKPANVFVCRYGVEVDFVKVLDFGLVKDRKRPDAVRVQASLQPARGELDSALTQAAAAVGTPAFMAPEMVMGGTLDGRTDLYAVGCLAFWLLTGRLVFEHASGVDVITAHVKDAPEPPSACSELPVPEELDALIISCLAKAPEERPESARALSEALGSIRTSESWTRARRERWWQVHVPMT